MPIPGGFDFGNVVNFLVLLDILLIILLYLSRTKSNSFTAISGVILYCFDISLINSLSFIS